MPIWKAPSVSIQPVVHLSRWSIREIDGKTKHLVGYDAEASSGRVSSAIESLDLDARRARTRSGRVYELLGSPGVNLDAEYVWSGWSTANAVRSSKDVTFELLKKHEAAGEEKDES